MCMRMLHIAGERMHIRTHGIDLYTLMDYYFAYSLIMCVVHVRVCVCAADWHGSSVSALDRGDGDLRARRDRDSACARSHTH